MPRKPPHPVFDHFRKVLLHMWRGRVIENHEKVLVLSCPSNPEIKAVSVLFLTRRKSPVSVAFKAVKTIPDSIYHIDFLSLSKMDPVKWDVASRNIVKDILKQVSQFSLQTVLLPMIVKELIQLGHPVSKKEVSSIRVDGSSTPVSWEMDLSGVSFRGTSQKDTFNSLALDIAYSSVTRLKKVIESRKNTQVPELAFQDRVDEVIRILNPVLKRLGSGEYDRASLTPRSKWVQGSWRDWDLPKSHSDNDWEEMADEIIRKKLPQIERALVYVKSYIKQIIVEHGDKNWFEVSVELK